MTLRAVVIGAGWAGEGHTNALRYCGVEVVAICARQADVVQSVADRLDVPIASTDWRQTLATVQPDIVALATPASLRGDVVEVANEQGSHLLCDKPLAGDAKEAQRLFALVQHAGVKHAYAATQCYDPGVAWLAELLHNGAIGQLQEVDVLLRMAANVNELTPWGWMDQLAAGGGALNNGLTHLLGMLERMIGGPLMSVTGEARILRQRAPVVPTMHDSRQRREKTPTAEGAAQLEWRECDADWAFSALLHFARPDGRAVQVCLRVNLMTTNPTSTNGWHFYGSNGTLVGEGVFALTFWQLGVSGERKALPVPQRLVDALPQVGDDVQNKWVALVQDFVADIRGEPHNPYLTFRDGWRYQEVIDAIRAGRGWYQVPELS
jgi:predicted dehydrogenase